MEVDGGFSGQNQGADGGVRENGGKIYACGTCLKIRDSSPELCPVSTMKDMYEIVRESDRVLTF